MRNLRHVTCLLLLLGLCSLPRISTAEECLDCHGDRDSLDPFSDRPVDPLLVVGSDLFGSVHEDLDCGDCHTGAADEDNPHYEEGGTQVTLGCGDCHEKALEEYNTTDVHGKHHKENDGRAPWCHDCHGDHQILPMSSKDSVMSPVNQIHVCEKCHETEALYQSDGIAKRRLLERYKESVHWQKINEGTPAATCSDCHGHHTILPSSDSHSHVTRLGILSTCHKCHPNEVQGYSHGSHGRSLINGNLDVPTCTTCHGDHDIISLKITARGVRDFASTQVCIWCHGNERMMSRYALDTTPVDSYMRDFHGLAQRGSSGTAATCADCHDAHRSLPESHPESRMHISNRGTACGMCHGQQSDNFILSFSHKSSMQRPTNVVVWWIKVIYVTLIAVTLGGMFLHNLVIWMFYVRRKHRYQAKKGTVVRLNGFELAWHWILLISFSLLGFTGFMLSFSDSWIFGWLYELGFTEKMRAMAHRFFAIIMTVDMLMLGGYMIVTRHGRDRWLWGMVPRVQDLKDFFGTMSYHLGFRHDRVRYGVSNYASKAEYWALWWGTVVMALSGLVLWFSELLPADMPPWIFMAARAVHFYEAVLAVGAIFVWHFFHVIFHPDEFPISTTFVTGTVTEHEAEERFTPEAIEKQRPPEDEEEPDPYPVRPWLEDDADDDGK